VAWKAIQHGELSVVVVDDEGEFLGIVPPRRLLAVLLQEHEEDLARLSGFTQSSGSARMASYESVSQRLLHRAPWLVAGLAGAMLAAGIVGGFEEQISRNVTLAFFVPAVVYMADAVGTQTETLIVRGLSLDVSVRSIAVRELLTGILLGLVIAALAAPAAGLLWGDWGAAVALGLALGAACSTATVVALTLPTFLKRLGSDPAYGSGPLATVVQDILSILIYFSIALLVGA
jgi:magnesium transporter